MEFASSHTLMSVRNFLVKNSTNIIPQTFYSPCDFSCSQNSNYHFKSALNRQRL